MSSITWIYHHLRISAGTCFSLLILPGSDEGMAGKAFALNISESDTVFVQTTHDRQNIDAHIADDRIWLLIQGLQSGDFENTATFEAYIEELASLFPVDLNRAERAELLLIPDIREQTVTDILEYRKNRDFETPEDLLKVPGIGHDTYTVLRPWVTAGHHSQGSRFGSGSFRAQQYFRVRQSFPVPDGFRNEDNLQAPFPGHPAGLYHRQAVSGNHYSANITQVKLPGEPMNFPAGFDFTSAYLSLEQTGPVHRLVAGDYSLRFGQGLTLWSAAGFGKGGVVHRAPYRNQHGITPYRSSGQTRFFRGVATEVVVPVPRLLLPHDTRLKLSGFYSNRPRSSVETNGDSIRPPSSSPFHRTQSELSRRHNTREMTHGGNIRVESDYWSAGTTYYSYRLDRPVDPHPQSHPLRGSTNRVLGIDVQMQAGTLRLFGEYAARISNRHNTLKLTRHPRNKYLDGKNAWVAGIMGAISGSVDWVFSLRNYSSGYWSEFGNGFGEGSGPPENQRGWYAGFRIRPTSKLATHFFIDRFRFPAPAGTAERPHQGWEAMVQMSYQIRQGLDVLFRLRNKERSGETEISDPFSRTLKAGISENRMTGLIRLNWQLSDNLTLKARYDQVQTGRKAPAGHPASFAVYSGQSDPSGFAVNPEQNEPSGFALSSGTITQEQSAFSTYFTEPGAVNIHSFANIHNTTHINNTEPLNTKSTGMALSPSVHLRFSDKWQFDLQWSSFDTGGFESRIYLFEPGLTNMMASRMVYGKGRVTGLVMRYRPAVWILLEVKYDRLRYFDRAATGSGPDRITGPLRSHIGLQLRLSY